MPASPRIVSLLASATEVVCRLGYGDHLVGRSHECDEPPEVVERLPVLSRPRFDPGGTSREIDEGVRETLERALGVYEVDADAIAALRPTHIVTQDHCEVCAVSYADLERAACAFFPSQPKIVSLHPASLGDILDGFVRVAEALGDAARGARLAEEVRSRIDRLRAASTVLPRRRVVHIEWLDPVMVGENWMPELIEAAGGAPVLSESGARSRKVEWDEVVRAAPEVVLIGPCGFSIERTRKELSRLTERPGWADLPAVKEGRVALVDGNRFFNRPGPRVAESAEIAAEVIHPERFDFGHEGVGWERCAP